MKRSALAITLSVILLGCGKKADETTSALKTIAQAAGASGRLEDAVNEAERFQQERIAKGDTVAMPYVELQKFLPESIRGYSPKEEADGQSQSMGGFSMSQAEQTWVGETGPDGATPEIHVSLIDFGGTQTGYAMMAAPMMMGFSQENARQRVGSIKIDVPHSAGWEEFDKKNMDSKITAVTRYRYVIAVEARRQGEDKSAMVKELAEEIAKKFDGK